MHPRELVTPAVEFWIFREGHEQDGKWGFQLGCELRSAWDVFAAEEYLRGHKFLDRLVVALDDLQRLLE